MEQLRSCIEPSRRQLLTPTQVHNAEDLIREIAVLELEVVSLEKYLLSMYRRAFDKRLSALSVKNHKEKEELSRKEMIFSSEKRGVTSTSPALQPQGMVNSPPEEQKLLDSSILRTHSSLSHAGCSFRTSPPIGVLAEALDSYHSLPLSMLERAQELSSNVENLGSGVSDRGHEAPNWLSEEMIRSISAIYCKLANPPLFNDGYTSSPISFSSPTIIESFAQGHYDVPEESREPSGHFIAMAEVQGLCRDDQSFKGVEHVLKYFRSLVSHLEQVDPSKMRHDEKLAFWINIHNSLVMHAFLIYGIPRSNLKRVSLLLKAAYNIGGKAVSVDMIQSSILGCRMPRPGQWIQSLFFPKQKFKSGDPRRAYSMEHPEPRLRFALCSGCHSDPVARLYTPKRVFQDLEVAKEEYIQTSIRVHKEQKVVLPKNVEAFIKEAGLCSSGVVEMIEPSLSDTLRKNFLQIAADKGNKVWKKIEWIPHNFSFRYLISNELAEGSLSLIFHDQ
ncbi:PREDICTED: uncharacterized protein LOC109161268 [Ipomoea nil]|uniref:uncharacterized protein LOC109161268 n=1 Tax=Ipomoea nil TaxID=35883 RepID=UPI000900B482|nr:PREDICTED: uncharacterized protein LOC109161268 [Ipomoea nil]